MQKKTIEKNLKEKIEQKINKEIEKILSKENLSIDEFKILKNQLNELNWKEKLNDIPLITGFGMSE